MSSQNRQSRYVFLLLCAGCVLAIGIFAVMRSTRNTPNNNAGSVATTAPPAPQATAPQATDRPAGAPAATASVKRPTNAEAPSTGASAVRPLLYFRANAMGDFYGKLAAAPLDDLSQIRYASELSCDRVYFSGGSGVCLTSSRGLFTTYSAVAFDEQMRPGWRKKLNGIPSRVRVSPSGRLASITVFISGHSYTSASFSTETTIIDTRSGDVLTDLEKFSVSRNGSPWQSPDFNFWGVTFARDESRFYATLSSQRKAYLVECDLAKRAAKVIHEDVECPSLSPDNTRIAFKKRTGPITWRIWMLDLRTMAESALGETRNVDDQVEWLDTDHVLYALPEDSKVSGPSTDLWSVPAGLEGPPQLLVKRAFSPAIVRDPLSRNDPPGSGKSH